jgi:hypothetical protein
MRLSKGLYYLHRKRFAVRRAYWSGGIDLYEGGITITGRPAAVLIKYGGSDFSLTTLWE